MDEHEIRYELERIRHEFSISHISQQNEFQISSERILARLERLERETARVKDWTQSQDHRLDTLLAAAQRLEKESEKSITPTRLRSWLIGLAALISALLVILAALQSYNQNQAIKHEEKRWIQEQRDQKIIS